MSEIGEAFRAMKAHRKEESAANHQSNLAELRASGLVFTERKEACLFREYGMPMVDFYQSTGRWRIVGLMKKLPYRERKDFNGGAAAFIAWYKAQRRP